MPPVPPVTPVAVDHQVEQLPDARLAAGPVDHQVELRQAAGPELDGHQAAGPELDGHQGEQLRAAPLAAGPAPWTSLLPA